MKKAFLKSGRILFLGLMIFLVKHSLAQQGGIVTGIAPLGFVNKIRLKAEYIPSQGAKTYGFVFSSYYPANGTNLHNSVHFRGVALEPFIRWYEQTVGEGFYFQLKATLSRVNFQYRFHWNDQTTSGRTCPIGIGGALGHQKYFGEKRRWAIDSSIGIRRTTPVKDDHVNYHWERQGPGSVLNAMILVSYRIL